MRLQPPVTYTVSRHEKRGRHGAGRPPGCERWDDTLADGLAGHAIAAADGSPAVDLGELQVVLGHALGGAERQLPDAGEPALGHHGHRARVAVAGSLLRQLHAVTVNRVAWDATIAAGHRGQNVNAAA